MDSLSAFAIGQVNRNKELKVFDWEKAALLIKQNRPSIVSAGLRNDWEYTGGTIYENGAIVPRESTYTYLASTWATPELDMDGDVVECYRMKSETPGWDSDTYWPEEARKILGE